MFSRLLTSGLIAGASAGFFAALLQLWFVQPVLLHAELYETGVLTHFGAAQPSPTAQTLPGFDLMRDGLSILFTMLVYAGYGLLLVSVMSVADDRGVGKGSYGPVGVDGISGTRPYRAELRGRE